MLSGDRPEEIQKKIQKFGGWLKKEICLPKSSPRPTPDNYWCTPCSIEKAFRSQVVTYLTQQSADQPKEAY